MNDLEFQGMIDDGRLVDSAGAISLVGIIEFIKTLFDKYLKEEVVLAQFEVLWAKVVANNWPRVPDIIERYVKVVAHDAIVAAIRHYLPA